MSNSTPIYDQLFNFLRQYSQSKNLHHPKTLDWRIDGSILSSGDEKAQSVERQRGDEVDDTIRDLHYNGNEVRIGEGSLFP
jgi:hypothetical protein